jgi:hypothetical protein
MKSRFAKYLAATLTGVAIESILATASLLLFLPHELELAITFALVRIIGRTTKATAVWLLCLYIIGVCNGIKEVDKSIGIVEK